WRRVTEPIDWSSATPNLTRLSSCAQRRIGRYDTPSGASTGPSDDGRSFAARRMTARCGSRHDQRGRVPATPLATMLSIARRNSSRARDGARRLQVTGGGRRQEGNPMKDQDLTRVSDLVRRTLTRRQLL